MHCSGLAHAHPFMSLKPSVLRLPVACRVPLHPCSTIKSAPFDSNGRLMRLVVAHAPAATPTPRDRSSSSLRCSHWTPVEDPSTACRLHRCKGVQCISVTTETHALSHRRYKQTRLGKLLCAVSRTPQSERISLETTAQSLSRWQV